MKFLQITRSNDLARQNVCQVHNQWSPLVSASLVLSQGAHAGSITNVGMIDAGGSSLPPLIHAPEMSMHMYCSPASSPLSQTSYM